MNDIDIESFLNELYMKGQINDSKSINKIDKYLNITPDTGKFLGFLAQLTSAEKILEVGTSNGYSAAWLALCTDEAVQITTIENDSKKISAARENFLSTGLVDKIKIIEGDAPMILSEMTESFDLVFVDMDRKLYSDILEDVIRLTRTKGVIVFDNAVSHKEEMTDVFNYFNGNSQFHSYLAPIGKGEFVALKKW